MKYQHKTNHTIIDLSDYEEVGETSRNWKPEPGEDYYFVDDEGNIVNTYSTGTKEDEYRCNILNCFRTEQEAESHRDYLLAVGKVTRRIRELNGDWDGKSKNVYAIDYERGSYEVLEYTNGSLIGHSYIKSKFIALQIISELTPELEIVRNYSK